VNQDPIPQDERSQAVRRYTQAQLEISQSPWPPPDIVERYESILPGSAERLIRLVEQEAEHRRALEVKQINSEINETRIGQWMAFLIGVFTIAAGAYTALQGAEWPGALMGSGGVIGLVAVFIYGRKQN
jgi:uncharacterized membrane protein